MEENRITTAKQIQTFEEKTRILQKYNELDSKEYPGWTFLLNSTIHQYGECPYLNVFDSKESKEQRIQWIRKTNDNGKLYFETVSNYINGELLKTTNNNLTELKNELYNFIKEIYEEISFNVTFVNSFEILVENIKLKKEGKTLNKKAKDLWNKIVLLFNQIYVEKGINMSIFVNAYFQFNIRYKPPQDSIQLGGVTRETIEKFTSICQNITMLNQKIINLEFSYTKERLEAEEKLYILIQQQFQIDQIGKYFKKWSSLTQEKKEERIKSYCNWYIRKMRYSISLVPKLIEWINEKIVKKEMTSSDIIWSSTQGIITNINFVIKSNEEEENIDSVTFEIGKRETKVAKKRASKKKNNLLNQNSSKDLLQRVNRVLLYELLKGTWPNKNVVIGNVLVNLHLNQTKKSDIMDYINMKYQEFVNVIKDNPIEV